MQLFLFYNAKKTKDCFLALHLVTWLHSITKSKLRVIAFSLLRLALLFFAFCLLPDV